MTRAEVKEMLKKEKAFVSRFGFDLKPHYPLEVAATPYSDRYMVLPF